MLMNYESVIFVKVFQLVSFEYMDIDSKCHALVARLILHEGSNSSSPC
jgi:hypothetical protein